jgi:hypothetical protein
MFCMFKKFGLFFEALTYGWDSVLQVKELSVVVGLRSEYHLRNAT